MASRNKLPLPDYSFSQIDRNTPAHLRKFIGVWTSVKGFNGGPVKAMIIVTDVNEAGEAEGHYLLGPIPPGGPREARGAVNRPLHGPIIGQRLSFATPGATVDATWAAANSVQMRVVEVSGSVSQIELVPVWSLVSGLASSARAVAPPAPSRRNSATRAVPATATAATEPAPAPQSFDSPGGGGRGAGRNGGRRPLGSDVLNSPRFPMCARMATERGLQGPGSGRRTYIRNCVASG